MTAALSSWNCQAIGEADCTRQFDKVPPTSIIDSLKEAAVWLRKKEQWRAQETVWSIHKDNSAHDHVGMGQHTRFEYITQEQLVALVEFSLTQGTYTEAAGQPWCRSASTHGRTLPHPRSRPSLYVASKKEMSVSVRTKNTQILRHTAPPWDTPCSNIVSLAQFRDNILMAATGPTCKFEMAHVCSMLTQAWGLLVMCLCITPTQPTCT